MSEFFFHRPVSHKPVGAPEETTPTSAEHDDPRDTFERALSGLLTRLLPVEEDVPDPRDASGRTAKEDLEEALSNLSPRAHKEYTPPSTEQSALIRLEESLRKLRTPG